MSWFDDQMEAWEENNCKGDPTDYEADEVAILLMRKAERENMRREGKKTKQKSQQKTQTVANPKKNQFQCENCKEIFTNGWSEDEAKNEAKELWGEELLGNDSAIVCDDCFKALTEATPPNEFKVKTLEITK